VLRIPETIKPTVYKNLIHSPEGHQVFPKCQETRPNSGVVLMHLPELGALLLQLDVIPKELVLKDGGLHPDHHALLIH